MEETQARHNWGTAQYFEEINQVASRGVRDIMYLGELFKEAKEQFYTERGVQTGWGTECQRTTGFKERAVQQFILINEKLRNMLRDFEHQLPVSWGTLSYLASLPSDEARLLLREGIVTRDMTRAEMIFAVKQCKELSKEFRLKFGADYFDELEDHIIERGLRDGAIEGEGLELVRDAPADAKVADLHKDAEQLEDAEETEEEEDYGEMIVRSIVRNLDTAIINHTDLFKARPKARSNFLGWLQHHKSELGITEITLDPDFEQ
jgi:hypothetical protein